MRITTKSGKVLELPNDEEEKSILAGVDTDADTYEPGGCPGIVPCPQLLLRKEGMKVAQGNFI